MQNVYYIPNQTMSLISVDKAISAAGFDSPDFKNLTWKADETSTLKMIKSNGTYVLDASVKYWTWSATGERSQY